MNRFRYPGINPFQETDQDLFFGREADILRLKELVDLQQLTLLYAKSGIGKSSLIHAGLIPTLLQEEVYKIVNIRLGAYREYLDTSPLSIVKTTLRNIANDSASPASLLNLLPEDQSLWRVVKSIQIQQNISDILFVFDQFEELFSYPEQAITEFKRELAELLLSELPQRYREKLESSLHSGQLAISDRELDSIHQTGRIKVLLSIRSDRLSLLHYFSDSIPTILQHYYALEPLNRGQAEEAILNPAYLDGSFASPIFDYSDEAIEYILDYLSNARQQKIESFQLQILCHHLENSIINAGHTRIELTDLEELDTIYKNYYDDQIAKIGDVPTQLAARKLIEEGLILQEEERRLSLYEGQIWQKFGVDRQVLKNLIDVHLLRAEPSLRGGYQYELCHDSLVTPILESYHKRKREEAERETAEQLAKQKEQIKLEQEKAAYEKGLRLQAEKNEKQAKRTVKLTIFAIVLSLLALSAFGALTYIRKQDYQRLLSNRIANDLAFSAKELLQNGKRNLAFSLADFTAKHVKENSNINSVIFNAYYQNDFPASGFWNQETQLLPWSEVLLGYENSLHTVAQSPTHEILATGSAKALRLWDLKTKLPFKELKGHRDLVRMVTFSPNGDLLASGSYDGTIILWDTQTWDSVYHLKAHTDGVLEVEFSPDGNLLATGSGDRRVILWDVATGQQVAAVQAHRYSVHGLDFSPDGKFIASGGIDSKIRLWTVPELDPVRTFNVPNDPVVCLRYTTDGSKLVYGGFRNKLHILDIEEGQDIAVLEGHHNTIYDVEVSPDGKRIATSSDDFRIGIWDLESMTNVSFYNGHFYAVRDLCFSPDGSKIISASLDRTLRLWEIYPGKMNAMDYLQHGKEIYSLAYSDDGKFIASGSEDSTAILWSLEDQNQQVFSGHKHEVNSVDLSSDQRHLATGSSDSTAIIWEVSSGKPKLSLVGHQGKITSVEFSPNGRELLTSSTDKTFKVWDTSTGALLRTYTGHLGSVREAAYSSTGLQIASAGNDGTIRLWNIRDTSNHQILSANGNGAPSLAFSPNDQYLIGGTTLSSEYSVRVWDLSKGGIESRSMPGHQWSVTSVDFSKDGKFALSGSLDRTIRLWDYEEGKTIQLFYGEADRITAVKFSPKNDFFASAGLDGTVHLWRYNVDSIAHDLKRAFSVGIIPLLEIEQFGLESLLDQLKAWDQLLQEAAPRQLLSFGLYFQKKVLKEENENQINKDLQKAEDCFSMAFTRTGESFYQSKVKDNKLLWAKKLMRVGNLEQSLVKMDEASQLGETDPLLMSEWLLRSNDFSNGAPQFIKSLILESISIRPYIQEATLHKNWNLVNHYEKLVRLTNASARDSINRKTAIRLRLYQPKLNHLTFEEILEEVKNDSLKVILSTRNDSE